MDLIFHNVWNELQPLKYRRSKRLFNRLQADGLIQVVYFQMGRNWSILHGKFTVEIGIFVPEVYSTLYEKDPPKFISTADCILRKRISSFKWNGDDHWWDLKDNLNETSNEVIKILLSDVEHYFNGFDTRDKILGHWEQERMQKQLNDRDILIMTIILQHSGQMERANQILDKEFGNRWKTAFLEYARNIVIPLGLKFPELY